MPTKRTLPILGTQGNVTHPLLIGGLLFQHYFLTDDSRTQLFDGAVKSITKDIQGSSDNSDDIADAISDSLSSLYGAYFDNVEVVVSPVKNGLQLEIGYGQEGKSYNLKRAIDYEGGTAQRLIEFNNLGHVTNRIDLVTIRDALE